MMSLLEKFSEVFEKNFYEAADTFGYREAKGTKKKEIREYAFEETLKDIPELRPIIEIRNTWKPSKGERPSSEQLEGQKFYTCMGKLISKYMQNGKYIPEGAKYSSIKNRFEEACRLGFVPTAEISAALLSCHRSYISKLIRESEEFSFTKVENGYVVKSLVDQKKKQRVQELEGQVALILKELQELKK